MSDRVGNDHRTDRQSLRPDLGIIADMIDPGARVLDVGCDDGALLLHLTDYKQVDGRGIELSMDGVHTCVSRGLSVIQGDADADLEHFPDGAFDYVVLSQTLQATVAPRSVLANLVRIGRYTIVSFPNFGYWRVRLRLAFYGQMPVTRRLDYEWWNTPNIHLCTILDFVGLCRDLDVTIERSFVLDRHDQITGHGHGGWTNLIGEQAVFLLKKRAP